MLMKTRAPQVSSTFAASRRCSSSRADRWPNRWSAQCRATKSKRPCSVISGKQHMSHPSRAGMQQPSRRRCPWAQSDLMIRYHDQEWGVPVHDDRALFEFLILEGAQAGLSWETVLRKRERYRQVFDGFDAAKIARYDAKKVRALLADPGIIRNRLKISAAISNAQAFLDVQREFGSFDKYLWQFTGGKTMQRVPKRIPAHTLESDAMSEDLKKRGFR